MLGTDLVSPRHLGNNCSRSIRFRDDPALLLLAPATPAANAGPDFNPATRPRSVKYIVNHIGEPIPPDPPTSADFSMSPQGAVKRPLTVKKRFAALKFNFDTRRFALESYIQRSLSRGFAHIKSGTVSTLT